MDGDTGIAKQLLSIMQSSSTKKLTKIVKGNFWTVENNGHSGIKISKNGVTVHNEYSHEF